MPKPLLLRRPSGLYVRFLVPRDLRPILAARFIVRSLHGQSGDAARLTAASLGYTLAHVFERVRAGMADKKLIEDVLAAAARGEVLQYTIAQGPRGLSIKADGPEDHARAMEAIGKLASIQAPVLASSPPPTAMLDQRIALFLKQFRQKKRSAGNILDTEHTLRIFLDVVGNKPLSSIIAEDMDVFLDTIAAWPPNASKKWPSLTTEEILRKARKEGLQGISHRTQEKHLDRLRTFFNWCMARNEMAFNPAKGIHILTREQENASEREPYTPQHLGILFSHHLRRSLCAAQPHRFFAPVLALFTGARVQEIGQLWTDDLDLIDGVWGIHLVPRTARGQRIKNAASKRFVPLHQSVLDIGLLAYRNDLVSIFGKGPLFPGLSKTKPGDAIGDWWNRTYLKSAGLAGEGLVFHTFRHTFASVAERCGIPEARIARLTGHSIGASVLRKHYIHPPSLPERAADIARLHFEGLPSLEPYRPGQFKDWFEKVRRGVARAAAVEARKARNVEDE